MTRIAQTGYSPILLSNRDKELLNLVAFNHINHSINLVSPKKCLIISIKLLMSSSCDSLMNIYGFTHLTSGKTLLNRFTLCKVLNSHVFVAFDSELGFKVVIKQAQQQQLQREWSCTNQCYSSNIIKPFACLPSLLVLPYIEGENLLSFTNEQTSLFIELIPQIVQAIQDVHHADWVHGDIKPSNFLYTPDNHLITLIDFGAAMPINTPRSMLDEWQLTPGFSSKANYQGIGVITPKDDWYALRSWLAQIDDSLLSITDKYWRLHWARWLDSQCSSY